MTAVAERDEREGVAGDVVSAARAVARDLDSGTELVPRLRAAGLLGMSSPAGPAADPEAVLHACEALAEANGSAGWLLAAAQYSGVLHWAAPEIRKKIPSDAFVTGTAGIAGTLRRESSCYRISGHWPAVPGAVSADWFALFVRSREGPAVVLLPAEEVRTSIDIEPLGFDAAECRAVLLEGVQVATANVFDPFGPSRATGSATLPVALAARQAAAAVALGLARRALYEFTSTARHRSRLGSVERMAEQPLLQQELNRTVSAFRAARELLLAETRRLPRLPAALPTISRGSRVMLAAAQFHAQDSALAAVRFAFAKAGGTALYTGHPLESRWRDSEALAQQQLFGEASERDMARAQFGSYVSPMVL